MSRRYEKELLGAGVYVLDNGASQQIEDYNDDSVDVDEDPFLVNVVDDDGYPGFRPMVDASNSFDAEDQDVPDDDGSSDLAYKQATQATSDDPNMTPDSEVLGDEFLKRVQMRNDHAVGDDGRAMSDLAMLSSVAQADKAAHQQAARNVRISPVSAYAAMMGNQVQLSTDNSTAQQVAIWSADSDVESQPVTVQFLPVVPAVPQPPNSNFQPLRLRGIINFGTRGVYTAIVDINDGIQLTLNASEVSLQVAMDPSVATVFTTETPVNVTVAGMLSFWPCVRTAPITYTQYVDNLAASAQSVFKIPAFARRMSINQPATFGHPGVSYNWFVTDSAGNTLLAGSVATNSDLSASGTSPSSILLPGSAYQCIISNTDSSPNFHTITAVFELGL